MDSEPAAAVAAGPLRRPVGPRSRRPPTNAGTGGARQVRGSTADDAAGAADVTISPLPEETAEEVDAEGENVFDEIGNCEPKAEEQDEDPAVLPRRPLPRGAVPLLVLPSGGGSPLKPRLARTPRPLTTADATEGSAESATPSTSPAVLEPSMSPKPRRPGQPPIGAAPMMTSMLGSPTDMIAMRQQLRRAASPQPVAPAVPSPEENGGQPPHPADAIHSHADSPGPATAPAVMETSPKPRRPAQPPVGGVPGMMSTAQADMAARRQQLRKTAFPLPAAEAAAASPPEENPSRPARPSDAIPESAESAAPAIAAAPAALELSVTPRPRRPAQSPVGGAGIMTSMLGSPADMAAMRQHLRKTVSPQPPAAAAAAPSSEANARPNPPSRPPPPSLQSLPPLSPPVQPSPPQSPPQLPPKSPPQLPPKSSPQLQSPQPPPPELPPKSSPQLLSPHPPPPELPPKPQKRRIVKADDNDQIE